MTSGPARCSMMPGAATTDDTPARPPITWPAPDDAPDPLGAVDPVLHRQDHRVGPDRRPQPLGGALGVVRLDAEENEIREAALARVVGGPGRDREVPDQARPHREPVRPDGLEVGAARDERHVLARAGEEPAEVPAGPAAAHHRHAHRRRLLVPRRF